MKSIEINGLCPLIQVFDMPASVAFYKEVLGFEVAERSDPPGDWWALLRRDGAAHMLNTAYEDHERPGAWESARKAGHADTALYFSCPDVDGAYRQLLAHGLDVEEPVIRQYGMKQVYVKDPDGYTICLQWPAEEAGESEHRE